jgi:hypothetical protein
MALVTLAADYVGAERIASTPTSDAPVTNRRRIPVVAGRTIEAGYLSAETLDAHSSETL